MDDCTEPFMLWGVPELLPRFRRFQEQREADKQVAKAILESGECEHPDSNGRVYRRSADGHNRERRRGLPVISRGVSGTAPGTDPVAELLRKEARLERRR